MDGWMNSSYCQHSSSLHEMCFAKWIAHLHNFLVKKCALEASTYNQMDGRTTADGINVMDNNGE